MNKAQKKKRSFRNSKKWKEFRHRISVKQKGLDAITLSKLRKGANLHHLDLREENYEDLSNEDNFVFVNKNTHCWLHEIFAYYRKDKGVIERLVKVLDEMMEING